MASTLSWLRARTDDELAALLAARPDLLLPAPGDLTTLARRVDSAASVRRAIGGCTAFELQVLQAVWVLFADDARGGSGPGAEPAGAIADFLGGPADAGHVAAALDRLQLRGLTRFTGAASRVVLGPQVRDGLGRYPAGLGKPARLPGAAVRAALGAADEPALALLRRLVPGPPIGEAPADSPHQPTIAGLIGAGLLHAGPNNTVILPQEVALALRGPQPLGPALPEPPPARLREYPGGTVDGAAAGQALAARGKAVALIELLGRSPAAALKSGGIGIVPLRQMAKELGVPTPIAALYLELLHGAGLLAPTVGRAAIAWVPTQRADTFLGGSESAGWALLADTWLNMRRDPSRVGGKDAAGKPITALSVAADWRSGPAERRRVLSEIAAATGRSDDPDPDGRAPALGGAGGPANRATSRPGTDRTAPGVPDLAPYEDSVINRLHYRRPLQPREAIATLVTAVLAEATEVGVVAFGAISSAGRLLPDADVPEVAAALEQMLPAPVESLLVQADMTVIAPGRLARHVADALAEVADVESAGGGTVYRLSEASVRRALDAGVTRAEIAALFDRYSREPVPQSVSYLIDDVARRHGVLRAGRADAFLHSDDPALLAQALAAAAAAGVPLRALAPTVAVSPVDVTTLVEALRGAGLAPAAEDATGNLIDLRPAPRRTRAAAPARAAFTEPAAASPEQITAVVRRMRAADRLQAANGGPVAGPRPGDGRAAGSSWRGREGADSVINDSDQHGTSYVATALADIVSLLRAAAEDRSPVWITYADAEGGVAARAVEPIAVSGGTLLAFDRLRRAARTFTLSRVSSAHVD